MENKNNKEKESIAWTFHYYCRKDISINHANVGIRPPQAGRM